MVPRDIEETLLTILRGTLPSDHFTIISNAWLRDPALSWKAKGLLAYIASHAAGHALTTEQIIAEGEDGKDAVRAGLLELERRGYLVRTKLRDGTGKITGTDYALGDPDGFASDGKPGAGNDQPKRNVSAGHDQSGKPGAGEPAGKKTTPLENTKNTPSASPRGHRLPEAWTPNDALLTWFVTELVPGGRWSLESRMACKREHAKFADHWKAAAGATSRKRDWDAAWRNWMRRAFEGRSPDAPVSGPPASGPKPSGPKLFEEMREDRTAQRKVRSQLIDATMAQLKAENPGMGIAEVVRQAAEMVDAHLKDHSDQLNGRTVTGYIDGDVIDNAPKEVTGSAA